MTDKCIIYINFDICKLNGEIIYSTSKSGPAFYLVGLHQLPFNCDDHVVGMKLGGIRKITVPYSQSNKSNLYMPFPQETIEIIIKLMAIY